MKKLKKTTQKTKYYIMRPNSRSILKGGGVLSVPPHSALNMLKFFLHELTITHAAMLQNAKQFDFTHFANTEQSMTNQNACYTATTILPVM